MSRTWKQLIGNYLFTFLFMTFCIVFFYVASGEKFNFEWIFIMAVFSVPMAYLEWRHDENDKKNARGR